MAGFNAGLPSVYQALGGYEQFSEGTRHLLTVSRSMITRIAGFFFFVYSTMETGNHIACWENHLGQALYSLMLTTTIIEWASSSYVDAAMHYLPNRGCGIGKLALKFGLEGKDPFDFKKHMNGEDGFLSGVHRLPRGKIVALTGLPCVSFYYQSCSTPSSLSRLAPSTARSCR